MKRLPVFFAALLAAAPVTAAVPFETATVEYEVAPRERVLDGRVEAVNQGTVSAQTSGRIAELPFDVNDFVDAGAVIARFTDVEQRAALDRAEADLAEARARLANAETEFERAEKMIANNTISQSRFDQASYADGNKMTPAMNLKGITALLAMLNSCVPGITVVNIDNGFGAGVAAAAAAVPALSRAQPRQPVRRRLCGWC